MASRRRIFEVLTSANENDLVATVYNFVMSVLIVVWMVPLWFKEEIPAFVILDHVLTAIFIVDYLLRWATADFKLKRGKASFLLYPFTPMAILDLLSFLPSFAAANSSLKTIRVLRIIGALRAFKLVRHSKTIRMLLDAAYEQRMPLLITLVLATIYVLVCATVMFNVEPFTYETFVDALYWAVISLTTIGYGDITPATGIGRIVAMISAIVGVAVIAFPSGIIAAGVINELGKRDWDELAERVHRANRAEEADQANQVEETGQVDQAD